MAKVVKLVEAVCTECKATYLRNPRSRSTLCCSCRPHKKTKTVRVLPTSGLAENAIQSVVGLEEYLSHDELECLICGTRHKGLYAHLRMAHQITSRDYKLKFGIPVTVGLIGKATREKMQLNAQATSSKMKSGGFKNLETARSKRKGTRVPWTEYQRVEKAVNMVESPNHPSKQEGMTILNCKKCGSEVWVSSAAAFMLQCRVLCDSCK